MPSEEAVLSEIDARGVAVVTLNRPAVNNACNGALIDALSNTCARLADEPSLRMRIGLVHEVVPAAELAAAGARIVEHLLLAAPEAAAMTKRLIGEAADAPDTPAFRNRIIVEAAARRLLPEAAEGLLSFAEKRKPNWYPES